MLSDMYYLAVVCVSPRRRCVRQCVLGCACVCLGCWLRCLACAPMSLWLCDLRVVMCLGFLCFGGVCCVCLCRLRRLCVCVFWCAPPWRYLCVCLSCVWIEHYVNGCAACAVAPLSVCLLLCSVVSDPPTPLGSLRRARVCSFSERYVYARDTSVRTRYPLRSVDVPNDIIWYRPLSFDAV